MIPAEKIPASEITPPEAYFSRRTFMRAGLGLASVAATGLLYRQFNRAGGGQTDTAKISDLITAPTTQDASASGFFVDEAKTPLESVAHYNNFYEFSTDKEAVAPAAARFVSKPWQIEIGGLCGKPGSYGLEDILHISKPEERVYRMRCVEAWSMVVPWDGFSLSKLLEKAEPKSGAKFVAFETLRDSKRMPGQNSDVLDWPYVEGLRIDEAMHPLTMLVSGLYGQELPAQNGAPLRIVIPWKYGFKGIKSIVKIDFVDRKPPTAWNKSAPGEYGFYANVNPDVPHPRWSQASEQRIGGGRRPTLKFNGYGDQVASLYAGMDLRENF